jgi:hypothetical protein
MGSHIVRTLKVLDLKLAATRPKHVARTLNFVALLFVNFIIVVSDVNTYTFKEENVTFSPYIITDINIYLHRTLLF